MQIEPLEPGTIETSHELITLTMQQLGDHLPHGLLNGPGRTPFSFRPPKMKLRKALGGLRSDKGLVRKPGEFACNWLAVALEELDGEDMQALKRKEAALKVAKLPVGDVLYLLFRWQAHARPEGLPLGDSACGSCGYELGDVRADLDTLEIDALPDCCSSDNPPRARAGLHHGMPYGSGEALARTVLVKPPTWLSTYHNVHVEGWNNSDLLKAYTLQGSICGLDVADVQQVPMSSIDELWGADIDVLDTAIARCSPTPNLVIELDCPRCDARNASILRWEELGFFGRS